MIIVRRQPAWAAGVVALLAGMVSVVPLVAAGAATGVPAGYEVVARTAIGPGAEHIVLRSSDPRQDVHVARLSAASGRQLVPVLANGVLPGPSSGLETTSSMCTRASCLVGVNGDFWDAEGRPIGAMVSAGELITTPGIDHVLLRLDGQGRPTVRHGLDWSVAVRTLDGNRVAASAVNRPMAGDGITLYSRRWGTSTRTGSDVTEVTLEFLLPSSAPLPGGVTGVKVGTPRAGGNSAIGSNQVVLAATGAGAAALSALAQRAALPVIGGLAALDVDLSGTVSAIGGSPQLLSNGKLAYPTSNADSFTQDRHPRTMVGITPSGEMLLVAADGNPDSSGLTLREAADLLSGLGAVDAVNLDGGGSTTFVVGGTVANRPRDGQRPVASALVLVPPGDLVTALLNLLQP